MPFTRRVFPCLSPHVLPLSPCNYNALYRIISRLSFSLDPGGVSRCDPVRAASWQYCGGVDGTVYIRGGVVFFSRPKRRTCGGWQTLYILYMPLRTNILYILYATDIIRYARLRFASKRTFRTQTEGTGRRACWRACIWRRAVCCGGVRCLGASIHPGGAPPPRRGTRSRNAAILRNFLFF